MSASDKDVCDICQSTEAAVTSSGSKTPIKLLFFYLSYTYFICIKLRNNLVRYQKEVIQLPPGKIQVTKGDDPQSSRQEIFLKEKSCFILKSTQFLIYLDIHLWKI